MGLLSRDAILQAKSRFKDVPVPEWGGDVRVRDMGGNARDRLSQFLIDNKSMEGSKANAWAFKCLLVSLTVCDDQGALLFSEQDVDALGHVSSTSLDLVFAAASELNGMSAKAQEREAKNSDSPSADSGSDSPGT